MVQCRAATSPIPLNCARTPWPSRFRPSHQRDAIRDERTCRYDKVVFRQITRWLPDDERDQLSLEFFRNLERIERQVAARTNRFPTPYVHAMFRRMSTSAPHPPELPDSGYHWTTDKALVFLGALADLGRVAEAARAVGMSRQSAYRLRARLGERGTFARAWDRAQAQGRETRRARRQAARKAAPLPPESDIFGLGR